MIESNVIWEMLYYNAPPHTHTSTFPFTYADYIEARFNLARQVNEGLTEIDREFLLSFENGEPDWKKCLHNFDAYLEAV